MLDAFARAFDNTYQEFFPKVLVAMRIANTRLLSNLSYGQSIDRVRYDISAVDVQDRTPRVDGTVDLISDERETLTVDQDKMTLFNLSQKEMVQAGPLNPGTVIGGQVAIKLATYVDADVLGEVRNAFADFDTGDLTTLVSNGTPITLNSTTVPQAVTRLPAKLRKNNQNLSNLALVVDSYGISDMFQYLLGKNADFVNALFQNGYVNEQVASAEVYVSENLTAEAVLGLATAPTAKTQWLSTVLLSPLLLLLLLQETLTSVLLTYLVQTSLPLLTVEQEQELRTLNYQPLTAAQSPRRTASLLRTTTPQTR